MMRACFGLSVGSAWGFLGNRPFTREGKKSSRFLDVREKERKKKDSSTIFGWLPRPSSDNGNVINIMLNLPKTRLKFSFNQRSRISQRYGAFT